MNLLIVESPAKCQKIRSFLGPDWTVLATMGHLRALDESLEAIGLGADWKPKYHWLKEKAKAIQQLKAAIQPETRVYLAADDDREGEMIAYSVCVLLKLPPTTSRVVFHEITEKAIQHAIQNPRTLDMNRVHAQQARAMLDLMIGFTISPLLWKNLAPSLSAGRCQTPALRLVIEREESIDAFQSSRSWGMGATWRRPDGQDSQERLETTMADELEDEDSVQHVLEQARDAKGEIINKEIRPWTEHAPPPLMTSTLQQQASQLFHCSPKQTMSVAQRLYEAGLITYMRTDKAVMSEEAVIQAQAWVRAEFGEAYVAPAPAPSPSSGPNDPKKARRPQMAPKAQAQAQEAHEAIRPTHLEQTAIAGEWGPMERKIYQLISRRALQSVMSPARGHRCIHTVLLQGLEDFPWVSEEKRTEFEGWRRLGRIASVEDEEKAEAKEKDEKESQWEWPIGTLLEWTIVKGYEKETSKPPRYTEASLVQALEKHGIGRPSTFASLLSVIQEKSYTAIQDIPPTPIHLLSYELFPNQEWERKQTYQARGGEKRKLVPTPLGRSVWEWLAVHFNDLFAYDFTATMERQLDQIAAGEQEEKAVVEQTWNSYQERYHTLITSPSQESQASQASQASERQRLFSAGIKAVQTKKGPLLLREGPTKEKTEFFGWPKGLSWNKITEEAVQAHLLERQGVPHMEWKGKPVMKRTGPYGPYLSWEGISIPFLEETEEQTGLRLDAKASPKGSSSSSSSSSSASLTPSILKETPGYWIRQGKYGPYILKKEKGTQKTQKTVFVSLPKGLDPTSLTDKEVDAIYQAGKASKAGRSEAGKASKAGKSEANLDPKKTKREKKI